MTCLGIEHLSFGVADEQAGERVFQLFIFAEIMLEGLFAHTDIRVAQEFMIGRSVEELLFTVDLHIFIGEPDALEGLVRDSGDLIDLAHEGLHLVAETVRDGAEELFHRIAEVRALRLLQIGADGVRMAEVRSSCACCSRLFAAARFCWFCMSFGSTSVHIRA